MADKAGTNTVTTLNGHLKEVYAENIKDLRPDGVKLLNRIDFIAADKVAGNYYHQPVILSNEHGFSYGGAEGNAFALNAAIASVSKDAQVRGTELVLVSYLSIAAASRSQNSKAAFKSETKLLVENMMKSMAKRLEIGLLYGQVGIGLVDSVSTTDVTITDAEWAAGIWSGAEGMKVTIFKSDYSVSRGDFTVSAVDLVNKTITMSADAADAGVIATDVIHFYSAASTSGFNEFAGIHKIITNTGTLFNVSAATYNLWKGNIVDVGTSGTAAKLDFDHVEQAIAKAMEKGLNEEDITIICSPLSWKNLLVEQTAKRQYDQSYTPDKMETGAKSIKFFGPNGMVEIVSSIYCKEGFAYAIPTKEYLRVGSTDVTFEQPGFEGKFIRLLESHNGYEMRCYTDQALFTSKPGLSTLLRYISNS